MKHRTAAMVGIFTALITIFITFGYTQADEGTDDMTDIRAGGTYSLILRMQSMHVRVFANGAFLVNKTTDGFATFTFPITEYLKSESNQIVIEFEPMNFDTRAYTPHQEVALEIELERAVPDVGTQRISGYSARWSPELQTYASTESSVFGFGALQRADGAFALTAPPEMTPAAYAYASRTSGEHARKITMRFNIDDIAMPTPPWIGAPVIKDTPELRAELLAANRDLHSVMAAQDPDQFYQFFQPVYDHLALVLGYSDGRAVVEDIVSQSPLITPDYTLNPAPTETQIDQSFLFFGSDNTLVRPSPNVVSWSNADGSSERARNVFFCRMAEGGLRPCHIQDLN
ncbi:hypothetical protein [Nereida sp. MMG025]|uniref:hypothetical protein n=1 Tax=Nereida sp. MMG025 TaxID=2909981 RepID=UPI001F1B5060|nr:hypothetical protein [Nereida sp. MMG025]MCF6445815.1 hypothetical protein [Nereida sp. MMG025]